MSDQTWLDVAAEAAQQSEHAQAQAREYRFRMEMAYREVATLRADRDIMAREASAQSARADSAEDAYSRLITALVAAVSTRVDAVTIRALLAGQSEVQP